MQFDDSYIFLIAFALFMLYFFRFFAIQCLECLVEFETRVINNCCMACCGCHEHIVLQMVRVSLIFFTFMQPLLFAGVHLYRTSSGLPPINLMLSTYSAMDVQHLLVSNSTGDKADFVAKHIAHIDFVIVCLPWSLSVSTCCLVWLGLSNSNELHADDAWGEVQTTSVMGYEIAYLVESILCNVVFFCVYCHYEQFTYIIVASAAVGCMQAFCLAHARVPEVVVEDTVTVLLAIVCLFVLFMITWQRSVAWDSDGSAVCAVTHLAVVFLSASFHAVVSRTCHSSTVVLVRVLLTSVSSICLLVYYSTAKGD